MQVKPSFYLKFRRTTDSFIKRGQTKEDEIEVPKGPKDFSSVLQSQMESRAVQVFLKMNGKVHS